MNKGVSCSVCSRSYLPPGLGYGVLVELGVVGVIELYHVLPVVVHRRFQRDPHRHEVAVRLLEGVLGEGLDNQQYILQIGSFCFSFGFGSSVLLQRAPFFTITCMRTL